MTSYIMWILLLCTFVVSNADHCQEPLGMEPGNEYYTIEADQLSASSQSKQNEVDRARLNGPMSWRAETSDLEPWFQVDLLNLTTVVAVETQGRPDGPKNVEYVKEYNVAYSVDGESWQNVTDENGKYVFIANADRNTPVLQLFSYPVTLRYIRIHPILCERRCSFRFELYGCEVQPKINEATIGTTEEQNDQNANGISPTMYARPTNGSVLWSDRMAFKAGVVGGSVIGALLVLVIFSVTVGCLLKRHTVTPNENAKSPATESALESASGSAPSSTERKAATNQKGPVYVVINKDVTETDQSSNTLNKEVVYHEVKDIDHGYSYAHVDVGDKEAMGTNAGDLVEVYAQSPLGGTPSPYKSKSFEYSGEYSYAYADVKDNKGAIGTNAGDLVEVYAQSPLGGTPSPYKTKSFEYSGEYSYAYADVKDKEVIGTNAAGDLVEVYAQSAPGGSPSPKRSKGYEYSYAYADVQGQRSNGDNGLAQITESEDDLTMNVTDALRVNGGADGVQIYAQSPPGGTPPPVKNNRQIYSYAYVDIKINDDGASTPSCESDEGWSDNTIYVKGGKKGIKRVSEEAGTTAKSEGWVENDIYTTS